MQIAVMGAPGTGKTRLVQAMRTALRAASGAAADFITDAPVIALANNRYDLVLLMGLDLPSHSANAHHDDANLRQILNAHGMAYTVVYGTGQARTDCALQAVAYRRQALQTRPRPAGSAWQWCCDTCSDASCERHLFTALVNARESVRP